MQRKGETKGKRRSGLRASRPQGGKALRRLIAYLTAREPELVDDLADRVEVPEAALPPTTPSPAVPARQRRSASSGRRPARARRAAPASSAAKSFAAANVKAATKVARANRAVPAASRRRRAMGRAAPPPPIQQAIWTSIGPSSIPDGQTYGTNTVEVIGRVGSIAIDPANVKHLLCGSANGGIWESKDTGATWAPRTDFMPALAIGAVTFDPHDSLTAYAGSGEGNAFYNLGAGVYRSTDGGTTWKVLAGAPFIGVGFFDLVVDPKNRKVLYAATTGGFYVSTNSGATWSRKRAVQCWDVSVHPNGGTVELLAAFQDGLFVSSNAGSTFAAVALPSAPAAEWDRLGVDRVAASPDVAYAFGASGTNLRLWRRSGTAWTRITTLPSPPIETAQAWYDWYVAASPTSSTRLYLGSIDVYRGDLVGGVWRWKDISTQGSKSIHPDQHCLVFAPDDANVIYAGNDGGIYRSANSGGAWTSLNGGLGITEIEYMASDPATWKWLMAGTQDNGTLRFKADTVWNHIRDGDGGDCGVNELAPNTIYHSYYDVTLERSNNKGNTWTDLRPTSMPALFYPPVEVSGQTLAIGGDALVVTRTGGPPWRKIPLGLAANDVASAMRAVDANTLLIGTARGRLLRAEWTGTTWKITPLPFPAPRYISCIAVDPTNQARIWVTLSQPGGGRAFRSDNGGLAWVDRTAGLPNIPLNSVVIDPANFKRVWIGADAGVYQTLNLGSTWTLFAKGLPNAIAADLLFHKQDRVLICGTRNRGVWVINVP